MKTKASVDVSSKPSGNNKDDSTNEINAAEGGGIPAPNVGPPLAQPASGPSDDTTSNPALNAMAGVKVGDMRAIGNVTGASTRKFDPARLRLSTDFVALAGVKRHVIAAPIRKPHKTEWARFHGEWNGEFAMLSLQDEPQPYILVPELYAEHANVAAPTLLIATVNTLGATFLTPVGLPGPDGRHNEAHRSLMIAAKLGMEHWVRIAWNPSLKSYDVYEPTGNLGQPIWPEITFQALLEIALRDRLIDDRNHPILTRLRGEG